MNKFNYTKMNRVLDEVQANLNNDISIDDKVNIVGGAIVYFEGALDEASNLDSKLKIDYVNYFYRELYNMCLNTGYFIITEPTSSLMIRNITKRLGKKKNNPFFNLMIDILMLNALSFMQNNMVTGAKDYFLKSIELGDKYLVDSRKDYHNSFACATNWMGYISRQEENYKDALKYYEKTYELYNDVKDMDGFYYKEYDPEDVLNNINEIKKILK